MTAGRGVATEAVRALLAEDPKRPLFGHVAKHNGASMRVLEKCGFTFAGVDKEFFAGTDVKSNFLCNVGYGDPAALRPRSPRFAFDEMAQIL